ncbi:MAG: DUF4142 domain-containing protein [Chitinophagaceae bacterium]|nr:MAG: DUF4142 domain-containing protein [Chitinophagaceae bacterium]
MKAGCWACRFAAAKKPSNRGRIFFIAALAFWPKYDKSDSCRNRPHLGSVRQKGATAGTAMPCGGMNFLHFPAFLTNKRYMKKTFVLPLLMATAVFVSCNGDGSSSNGSSDTTVSTTSTTTINNDTAATAGAPAGTNYSSTPLGEADMSFVKKVAMGGMMEVQSGNLAQSNAANDRVKAFGQMMVRDHQMANEELMNLARAKGMTLTDSMDKKMQDHMAEMQKMQGKSFDKHYMGMMVDDHGKTIADFEKAANGAQDADLKAWAAKTLPTLRMHADSAKAINSAIK